MKFKIMNPQKDMHGNKKENIFIAKDIHGKYLGHSYASDYVNYHSSYAKPRNIYIEVDVPIALEESNIIQQSLFDCALKRSYEIKDLRWMNETVRIYGGAFSSDKEKLNFYLKQGFIDDDAGLVMKNNLEDITIKNDKKDWYIVKNHLDNEIDRLAFIERHNSIFPNELSMDKLNSLMTQPNFGLYGVHLKQELAGECMLFEKGEAGFIEMFYVNSEVRGKGASNVLMNFVLRLFKSFEYKEARLGVWQRNERAMKFYERHGFRLTGEREEVFPGIDV